MLADSLYFENLVFRFIYSFHMPCLMLLSGFFFSRTVEKEDFGANRITTLLIPIVAWSIVPAGLGVARAVLNHSISAALILYVGKTVLTYYWFLWAILFCSAIVWLVHKCLKDNSAMYLGIGILLLFVPEVLNVKLWIYMYPYYVVGYLFNKKGTKVKWAEEHKILTAGILIASFVAMFFFYNTNSFIYTTGIAVQSLNQLGIDLYRYIIGFTGSAMVIWIMHIYYPIAENRVGMVNKALCYCGKVSLAIYIVDCLLNSYVLPRVTKAFTLNYGIVLIETVIVLLLCIGVDWLIKKIPIARKILLGSR